MEGSYPPPSDSNPTAASGASKFLTNLPNRGLLSSIIPSAYPGGVRVYICDHDTSPPENQLIKTNQMNILIRSLVLEKQKGESSSKDAKGIVITGGSRKRAPARALDGRTSSKRAMTSTENSSRQEGSKSHASDKDFRSLKMDELRALLREKGLSIRGRKGELITRLRSASG